MNLHAIDLPQLFGQRRADGVESPRHRADAVTEARRADGVGRPKFDFHTGSDQPDPALVEASLDADAENALPIAQPRTPAGNVDESVDVVVARVIGDHSARIQSLPADQQCAVADRVVDAKERLKGALKAHLLARPDPAAPVTPEDVHAAVRSMAAARPDEGSLSDEESVRSEQEGY